MASRDFFDVGVPRGLRPLSELLWRSEGASKIWLLLRSVVDFRGGAVRCGNEMVRGGLVRVGVIRLCRFPQGAEPG